MRRRGVSERLSPPPKSSASTVSIVVMVAVIAVVLFVVTRSDSPEPRGPLVEAGSGEVDDKSDDEQWIETEAKRRTKELLETRARYGLTTDEESKILYGQMRAVVSRENATMRRSWAIGRRLGASNVAIERVGVRAAQLSGAPGGLSDSVIEGMYREERAVDRLHRQVDGLK